MQDDLARLRGVIGDLGCERRLPVRRYLRHGLHGLDYIRARALDPAYAPPALRSGWRLRGYWKRLSMM